MPKLSRKDKKIVKEKLLKAAEDVFLKKERFSCYAIKHRLEEISYRLGEVGMYSYQDSFTPQELMDSISLVEYCWWNKQYKNERERSEATLAALFFREMGV